MLNIRYKIFETNSSSTHSIVMCTDEEYKKLRAGELMIAGWESPLGKYHDLVPRSAIYDWFWFKYKPNNLDHIESEYDLTEEEIADNVEEILAAEDIAYTFDNYGQDFEWYDTSFTTPGGETVHAFGYYGNDW